MNPKSMKTLSDTPAKPEHFEVDLGSPVTFPMEAFQRPRTPALMGAEMCLCEPDGINYSLHAPNCDVKLERDVDFGVVPGTKRPSLFKSGAEKVALAYGLLQHYTVENSIEQFSDEPFCFYRVRCDLTKIGPDGKLYIIATGYGSGNTKEKRNGRNDAYNAANSTLKMAAKRALVAAALSVSSLSNMFSQDMENEDFVEGGTRDLSQTNDSEALLTRAQLKAVYAVAAKNGLTAAMAKKELAKAGYSIKEVKQKDYAKVLAVFEGESHE